MMVSRIYQNILLSLSAFSLVNGQDAPNLIPRESSKAPNYWCTWYAQNYWQQRGGEITNAKTINNPNAQEELSYKHIFDKKEGWAVTLLPETRQDYYFLIDHGWQTKKAAERVKGAAPFFSLQMDVRDFPEFAKGKTEEQLRLFNEEIKKLGWRGLGIWVRGELSPQLAEQFVKWSKHAGVEYWKIDGGDINHFNAYKAKQKHYPQLVLEYVDPIGNINPNWDKAGLKEYPSPFAASAQCKERTLRILQHSDVLRTYDATPQLLTSTTMRRAHDILKMTAGHDKYISVLNLQDDCNIAAALGCLVASKRHPNYMERLMNGKDYHHQLHGKRHMQKRMDEVDRFARWSRIAPAFPAGHGFYRHSEEELVDSFPFTEYSTWFAPTYGKTVYQSAPAIMARNMPLPKVESESDSPFVVASRFPNGVVAVALEGRVKPENEWYYPAAKVTIEVDGTQVIGIFGYYKELVIDFADGLEGVKHIWAQDILADKSSDIIKEVKIVGNKLILSGELIKRIGLSAATEGDQSSPGMIIKIER